MGKTCGAQRRPNLTFGLDVLASEGDILAPVVGAGVRSRFPCRVIG